MSTENSPERGTYTAQGTWESDGTHHTEAHIAGAFFVSVQEFDARLSDAIRGAGELSSEQIAERIEALEMLLERVVQPGIRTGAEMEFIEREFATEKDMAKIIKVFGTYATLAMGSFASAVSLMSEGRVGAGLALAAVSSVTTTIALGHMFLGKFEKSVTDEFEKRITKLKFLRSTLQAHLEAARKRRTV